MKKLLMIAGASVLLVSGLGAGVFAKYNSTLDAQKAEVTAKSFYMGVAGDQAYEASVKLSPGESQTYAFSVVNYNASIISEVDIDVTGTITIGNDVLAQNLVFSSTSFTDTLTKNSKDEATWNVTVTLPESVENEVLDENGQGLSTTFSVVFSGIQA